VNTSSEYSYVGSELGLFFNAVNWKKYWSARLREVLRGDVLDVGAGLGSTFDYLYDAARSWTCLEPDASLCRLLDERLSGSPAPPRVVHGTLCELNSDERFDTILYIDVLEHIENDRAEVELASRHMRPGGRLVVLSPAIPFLYSEFDRSVGHFRRYTAASLEELTPEGSVVESCYYLDGLGALASLFARVAKRSLPTRGQIETWDKVILPASRRTDFLTTRHFGRTIVMIWRMD